MIRTIALCLAVILLGAGAVRSDAAQPVQLRGSTPSLEAAHLNGGDAFADDAALRAGANELLLVYRAQTKTFSPQYAGCIVRLADPATGERLTTIQYEPH